MPTTHLHHRLLMLLAAATLLAACDEDYKDVSPVALLVYPQASEHLELNAGEQQRYKIDFVTEHDYVSRLCIASFDAVQGSVPLLDTTFTTAQTHYDYDYRAPYLARDSVSVSLSFQAWDNTGSHTEVKRSLAVRAAVLLLAERTGIVLHAPGSGLADAFAMAAPSQTFHCETSPDSLRADVCLLADDDLGAVALYSRTRAKMVRFNSFDYAAATPLSVQAAYDGARRADRVDNLRTNDIVIVGHEQAEGVIFVSAILRTGSPDERCVQLSVKPLALR